MESEWRGQKAYLWGLERVLLEQVPVGGRKCRTPYTGTGGGEQCREGSCTGI